MERFLGEPTGVRAPAVSIIQDGAMIHCNSEAARLLDLDRSSSAGSSLKDLFHPDDLDRLEAVLQRVLSGPGGMEVHPVRILTGRGDARQVEMATMAFEWKDKPATLNLFRTADSPLVKAPAEGGWMNLADILNTINDVVYLLDPDGRITYVNEVVRRYGYSPGELIGRPCVELVHPDDRVKLAGGQDDGRSPVNSARYFNLRLRCPNLPGQTGRPGPLGYQRFLVWVEDLYVVEATGAGRLLGSQGCAWDIPARRRTGGNQLPWTTAAELTSEAMIIFDADWDIVDANPAALSLFGPDSGQPVLPRLAEALGLDPDRAREALAGGGEWSGAMSASAEGDRRLRVKIVSAPVEDDQGVLTHLVAVIRDMTQEQHLKENLQDVQKGEIISALASGIAHNFNNILTTINGYNELSLARLDQDNPVRPYLEKVAQAAARAEESVKEMAALCLSREQEPRPIEMIPLVREGITLLRAALPSAVTLRPDLDVESDLVLADPTRIKQVLISLGANIAQAMDRNGGVLEVTLSEVDVPARPIRTNVELEPGPYLRLSVGAAGTGLDFLHGDRRFEPLSTPQGSHSVPALHVAQRIVQSYGGDVVVENRAGRGVVFHVYLPRTGVSPDSGRMTKKQVIGGAARVLFVDDDESMVDIGERMLVSLGHQVTACRSSVQALDKFRASPGDFDLVLTDQSMPGLTGLGLAEEIQRISPETPIILCTGFSEQETRSRLNLNGISAVITKPLTKRKIRDTIARVLEARK
jgi:PAS domain-containing protein/ActR/RegA family two-component response regulator